MFCLPVWETFLLDSRRRWLARVARSGGREACGRGLWAGYKPPQTGSSPDSPRPGHWRGRTRGAPLVGAGMIWLAVCHTGPCLASWSRRKTALAICPTVITSGLTQISKSCCKINVHKVGNIKAQTKLIQHFIQIYYAIILFFKD